ncbi:hypothetical protein B0H15DRAFT_155235 [Mycena belliarum]|uniref:F-box domain-containing protein n=1 Tax=Mycena belliarum TaxID=1033014 RepID=A0AAD6UBZ2_9AGAR|nr:hypothetical protein B0H15DRAFT_155235 [Mycena belliae]
MPASVLETCPKCGFDGSTSTPEPAPFPAHLLSTNEPPTSLEASVLGEALEERRAYIARLDNTIDELQAMLVIQRRRRRAATDRFRLGTTILSVTRRIPTDILVEIFQRMVPDEPWKRPIERTPWVLGRVCSRWRSISQSLPNIWVHLEHQLPLKMLEVHLARSLPHLLTVKIGSRDTPSLRLLLASSTRWETADVSILRRRMMEKLLQDAHGQFPALRRLTYYDITGRDDLGAFSIAPALRDAALSGDALPELPWAQLERLSMRFSAAISLAGLRTAKNLVELTIMSCPVKPHADVELPHLRTLFIDDETVLPWLILPALEDLYMSVGIFSVPAFIERSGCALTRFTTDVECQSRDIIAILKCTPALVEARMTGLQDPRRLLTKLTVPPELSTHEPPIAPVLRALGLSNIQHSTTCAEVVAMMESRRASAACPTLSLCVLDIPVQHWISTEALQTFEVLRDKGFEVEWFHGSRTHARYQSWR